MTVINHQCYNCGCTVNWETIEDGKDDNLCKRDRNCGCNSRENDDENDDY